MNQTTPSPITSGEALKIARDALSRVIDGIPAFADGAFYTEHFDMDGNPIGVEQHDPVSIIQCMAGVAAAALAITEATITPSGELPPLPPTQMIGQNALGLIYGYTDAQMQTYARSALAQRASAPDEAVVLYQYRTKPGWDERAPWGKWEDCTKESFDDYQRVPKLHDWSYEVRALAVVVAQQPADGGAA